MKKIILKNYKVFFSLLCLVLLAVLSQNVSANGLTPFNITGYTIGIEEGGQEYLNETNVTIEIYQRSEIGPPSLNATLSTLSNGSGYFNITIDGEHLSESFMYKIVLIKYNENYARFIGPNLPYFPAEQISNLGTVYFYLRPAITIDISAIGQEYVTEDESKIEYNNIGSFPEDYKTGLAIINNSGEKQYTYINGSDCLIFLNETLDYNNSFCDLNITNIKEFTDGPVEEGLWVFYFINLTGVQRCFLNVSEGTMDCNEGNYTDLSSEEFSEIGGISFNEFAGEEGKFFVSALNGSGESHVYIYYPNFTLHKDFYTPNCYVGKMLFNPGGGFGIGNNSGRYVFYKIFMGEDFSCDRPVNLTEGLVVNGFVDDVFYENPRYFIASSSPDKNLTNINFFTNEYAFRYQFKDKKLGYGIKESFNELKYFDRVYIPADRNYSLMIYPEGGPAFPVSIELNNLVYGNNISLGTVENRTITSINQALYLNLTELNLTTDLVQLSGFSKLNGSNGNQNFDNYTVVGFLLEAGKMVFLGAMMPQNIGQHDEPPVEDVLDKTTGFYNITLPAALYGANILLFASAKKEGVWYGGFKTVTLNYGENPTELNLTLYPMVGEEATLESKVGEIGEPINTSLFAFNITSLLEDGNKTGVTNVHAEIEVDYSKFSGSDASFSWMADSGDNNIIKIPLLNDSINIRIFSPQFPPIKRTIKVEDLQESPFELILEQLKAKRPDGEEIQNVQFRNFKYKDDGSCSVPWPNETPGDLGCLPEGVGQGGGPPNPFTWVISGGKYDLEMRQNTTNITIHYVNVDLLASQPPDGIFDESANKTPSGNMMKEAWRFGSMGPNIYDYVIIGVPYNSSAINESEDMKVNITKFYDEEWQYIWEQGEDIEELNGTDYEDYKTDIYIEYINGSAVLCNESDENLTGLCYKDLAHNMVWFKIPHFSGIEPNIVGKSIVEEEEDGGGNRGGGGTTQQNVTNVTNQTNVTTEDTRGGVPPYSIGELSESSKEINMSQGETIQFIVNGEEHVIKILNIGNNKVTIEINSLVTLTIQVGEAKNIDLDRDGREDITIKIKEIKDGKVTLIISKFKEIEEIPLEEEAFRMGILAWTVIIVAIVAVVILLSYRKKFLIIKEIRERKLGQVLKKFR
ncbi:MAG: hypothetical protein QXP53_00985 [Candidatus Pacearchaeota archaeon]